jgi:hypothetical protein
VYCTYTTTGLKDATIPQDDQITPDSQEANDFILYPNPAKSFINVDYSDMPELGTTIEIFDSNGRTLYKKPAESTSNRIEIGQLSDGVYYIRSIGHQKCNVKKLIVK